ncbi:GNAT family N-acetyltransferase [Chitinophaga sp. Cy-1792]|uniref:GNAT family N-acetyltransferase n=1 Tax=Chitinophaga sp. Cy-1792 TaxID=2608339 RepID=UPI00142374F1|nr:GNAT family N-acetyltransferase [Chitinophaga sp. Cy-1792]NIG55967.1 GNAT family N-acetyltransferase [Chitinophaga sp. Cy-1792]
MKDVIQAILENEVVKLQPLTTADFDALYAVAADPRIWEQHPEQDRWKKEVFRRFFNAAIASKGAYSIIDKKTGEIAGSTRFYKAEGEGDTILIGYTFFAVKYWGTGFNNIVKKLMLNHIFQYVEQVNFHVGEENFRSQQAIAKLGAIPAGKEIVTIAGEAPKVRLVYALNKSNWH